MEKSRENIYFVLAVIVVMQIVLFFVAFSIRCPICSKGECIECVEKIKQSEAPDA